MSLVLLALLATTSPCYYNADCTADLVCSSIEAGTAGRCIEADKLQLCDADTTDCTCEYIRGFTEVGICKYEDNTIGQAAAIGATYAFSF